MGGGGGGSSTNYQRSKTPDVFIPVAPERTVAETSDDLNKALFEEGVTLSKEEQKKKRAATSRLVIPMDNSQSSTTGGTTPPPKPKGLV